jgi:3-methyladenine DNA glycosylase AlkD
MTDKFTPKLIREKFLSLVEEEYRIGAFRYFKEEVDLFGVRSGNVRKLGREAVRWCKANGGMPAALKLAIPLWSKGKFEEKIIAVSLVMGFEKELNDETWQLCSSWVDDLGNWANCDNLSTDLIGAHLDGHEDRRRELVKWTGSENRWRRRASAVSLVKHARKGKYLSDVWKVSTPLMPDKDDMVRKGVGWLLREAARLAPGEVTEFCKKHEAHASRLILRTASETMPEEWKKRLLGK